jgi:nucleoid-associated protein YgaU
MSRRSSLMALVVISGAAVVALHVAGSGSLAAPPVSSWSALERWYDSRDPSTAIVAVLRAGGLAAAAWLAAAGALQLCAPLIAGARGLRLADSLSPRFVRSLARGAAGLSVTAGLAMPTVPLGFAGNPPGTAVMVPLDVAPTTTSTAAPIPPRPTSTTTISTTTSTSTSVPSPSPAPPLAAPAVPVSESVAPDEVVVAAGDSFWSIAVDEARGGDLVRYWRVLIELNRDRLVDRANPDLLYPDQVLRLPPHDLTS